MPVTLTPLKVLIVDDSAIFRKILRNILIKEERFSVVGEARHGEEALKLIKRHQPDALILDVDMPIMDGLETLKAVRKDHPGVESHHVQRSYPRRRSCDLPGIGKRSV
jgi:two-component system chemotaxis response regulator CheB